MAARIGIELAGGTCRIVELDPAPRWGRGRTEPRVTAFASLALTDPESTERFAALRGRGASVVIWTPHSSHRHVEVADGSYDRMRDEALAAAGGIGPTRPPVLSDIASAALHVPGLGRRQAIVASVPSTEAAGVLRPLRDAGIRIDAVLTPAAALMSVARLGRGSSAEGVLDGYVALEESASAFAIGRDRHLVAVRTVPWGFLTDSSAPSVRARDEIVQRLASELSMCMASTQLNASTLAQVFVCGALPELRSMAVSLTERLDVEVETLDGLFGIDATQLPEPASEFRERAAELRIAWAAAADRRPTLDLLRERKRRERKAALSKAAIVAGVAAGLAGGWALQKRWAPVELVAERTPPAGSLAGNRPTEIRRADDQPPARAAETPVMAVPTPSSPGPPSQPWCSSVRNYRRRPCHQERCGPSRRNWRRVLRCPLHRRRSNPRLVGVLSLPDRGRLNGLLRPRPRLPQVGHCPLNPRRDPPSTRRPFRSRQPSGPFFMVLSVSSRSSMAGSFRQATMSGVHESSRSHQRRCTSGMNGVDCGS